jgi:hypothetical protein
MCVDESAMHDQTKFLHLRQPVSLGDHIDNWRVCWLGGWDKCRVFFVVMVGNAPAEAVSGNEVSAGI